MEKNLTAIVDRVHGLTVGHRVLVVLLDYWSVWLGGAYAAEQGEAYVATAQKLTDEVNTAIKSVATGSGSAYVDLRAAFKGPDYAFDETIFSPTTATTRTRPATSRSPQPPSTSSNPPCMPERRQRSFLLHRDRGRRRRGTDGVRDASSILIARRSSIARYPSAACSRGRVEVEDLAGVDLPVQIRSIRSGRKRRTGAGPPCRWTWEKNSSSPGSVDVVGDADVADVAAGAGGADGLHHRFLGADGFDHRVRAEAVGEVLDRGRRRRRRVR